MTRNQTIDELVDRRRMHLEGTLGYIGQDPSKNDIFKLFAVVYRHIYFSTVEDGKG